MSEVVNIKELNALIERESVFVDSLNMEMSKVIVGQKHLVDSLLIGLLSGGHILLVSFGIFSIIRLIRPAQYLIHASEYVIPDKECVAAAEDDPCAIFRSLSFPTREFSPPPFEGPPPGERGGKCGC